MELGSGVVELSWGSYEQFVLYIDERFHQDIEAQIKLPESAVIRATKSEGTLGYDDITPISASNAGRFDERAGDRDIVWWEGNDDPENPMNWPGRKKWTTIAVSSAIWSLAPLGSSMFAPGVPELMKEFHDTNTTIATLVVSIYLLGSAIGPLVLSPASEIWGRSPVCAICMFFYVLCTVGCALSNSVGTLIAFRFLAGAFGAAPFAIGGGIITDIVVPEQRGGAMAIFAVAALLAPIVGPIVGGYLTQATSWRWDFWVLAILSGVLFALTILCLRETYAPIVLNKKVARLRKQTGNQRLRSKLASTQSPKTILINAIIRPIKMLVLSPTIFLFGLFMAISYGYLYVMFTSFPFVFEEQYGFSTGTVGLTYLGVGIGCLVGLAIAGTFTDRIYITLKAKNNGVGEPEFRLSPMNWTAPLIPIGLFIYGWTAEKRTHWIIPIIGTGFVGTGSIVLLMVSQTYIIDAFAEYSASAVAAVTVFRCVAAAFLPLAGTEMYAKLGLGMGNSVLAFIGLAMCPVPWAFKKWGRKIRNSFRVNF